MNGFDRTFLIVSRIGVFLIPFVPLIIAASLFFPFITGKNFAFRIIAEVIFACWFLLALRRSEFRPRKSGVFFAVFAFLGVIFLADIFAENPFKAFWSNFERMEGFVTLAHLGAYFLVASSVLNTERLWHRFFATSIGVSAFLGMYGILQLLGEIVINQGGVRLDGTFGNAAYFAGYMLFHVFLILFLALRSRTDQSELFSNASWTTVIFFFGYLLMNYLQRLGEFMRETKSGIAAESPEFFSGPVHQWFFLLLLALAFVLIAWQIGRGKRQQVAQWFAAIGLIPLLISFFQLNELWSKNRFVATLLFLPLFLHVCFWVFRRKSQVFSSIVLLVGGSSFLGVVMIALYFTATRGSFLGLVAGLLISSFLITVFERERKGLRRGAAACTVVLIVAVSALFAAKESTFVKGNPVLTRFASISQKEAGPRFMVWGMAFQGFKENPLLGWGQEGFNYVFNKYYNPDMWAQEQWFDRTHNIFLDWLTAGGLLGLLAYLALFGAILWYLWFGKPRNEDAPWSFVEKSILTGLLAAYTVHNFFVFDNIGSYILFFSLLAFFGSRFGTAFPRLEKTPSLPFGTSYYVSSISILVLLITAVYGLNIRGIKVASALISGLRQHPGGVTENLSWYRKAFARETVGSQEVAEQVAQTAVNVVGSQDVPAELKEEFIAFATKTMEREIARAPTDARLQVFLGTFANRLGRFDLALTALEKAHELSPMKQTISFELAGTYLNTGKAAEAVELLRKAFESAPEFTTARKIYGISAIYAKNLALAGEILAPIESEAIADDRVVKAYFDVKAYDKVLAIWKARVERNPADAQTHVSLAAAELLNNNRTRAIAELQKAVELNPALKIDVDKYISEIRAGRNP